VSRRGIRPGARTCGRDLASPLPTVWGIFSPNRPGHSVRTTQRPMTMRSSLRDTRSRVNRQPRLICGTLSRHARAARSALPAPAGRGGGVQTGAVLRKKPLRTYLRTTNAPPQSAATPPRHRQLPRENPSPHHAGRPKTHPNTPSTPPNQPH